MHPLSPAMMREIKLTYELDFERRRKAMEEGLFPDDLPEPVVRTASQGLLARIFGGVLRLTSVQPGKPQKV